MKRLFSVLLLITLTQTVVNAQEKVKSNKESERKQTIALMKEEIKRLKEGALLVRLQKKIIQLLL